MTLLKPLRHFNGLYIFLKCIMLKQEYTYDKIRHSVYFFSTKKPTENQNDEIEIVCCFGQ